MKSNPSPSPAKPVVRPVRKLSPRIGRVYAWSPRPVWSPRYSLSLWAPSVEYTLASVRAFCATLN